jgi:hypothetical protein
MTATEAEALVRKHWQWVQVRLSEPYEGVPQGKWVARLPLLPFSQIGFDTEDEAWFAAAAFTEQRREEIRQVEEEIDYVSGFNRIPHRSGKYEEHPVWTRILAREQAALDALRQGWKEDGDGKAGA